MPSTSLKNNKAGGIDVARETSGFWPQPPSPRGPGDCGQTLVGTVRAALCGGTVPSSIESANLVVSCSAMRFDCAALCCAQFSCTVAGNGTHSASSKTVLFWPASPLLATVILPSSSRAFSSCLTREREFLVARVRSVSDMFTVLVASALCCITSSTVIVCSLQIEQSDRRLLFFRRFSSSGEPDHCAASSKPIPAARNLAVVLPPRPARWSSRRWSRFLVQPR